MANTNEQIELDIDDVKEETLEVLAESLADDLLRVYKNFYFDDAKNAFHNGALPPQISTDALRCKEEIESRSCEF